MKAAYLPPVENNRIVFITLRPSRSCWRVEIGEANGRESSWRKSIGDPRRWRSKAELLIQAVGGFCWRFEKLLWVGRRRKEKRCEVEKLLLKYFGRRGKIV